MSSFKIFYSWQSDIPTIKAFIRRVIDSAIFLLDETETIEAERDEATKGLTGSPNIVESIYKKIESCDLFIADITSCYKGVYREDKMSPNPNVLLELGFAAKCLGWDRIICLCNSDKKSNYPFDIAQNKVISFSLENTNSDKALKQLAKYVCGQVTALQSKGPKAKNGQALHIVGSYSPETRMVEENISFKDLKNHLGYKEKTEQLIQHAREEVEGIDSIIIDHQASLSEVQSQYALSSLSQFSDFGLNYKADKVTVPNVEIQKRLAKLYLDVNLTDAFFDIGALKKVYPNYLGGIKLIGNESEKEKYNRLIFFFKTLEQIDVRHKFIKTFSDCSLLPLAIHNCSAVSDHDIRVVLRVEIGEIIVPNRNLLCEELRGQEDILYYRAEDNNPSIMEELISLQEDGTIHFDDYLTAESDYHIPLLTSQFMYENKKRLGSDTYEYEKEIKKLIASPVGENYYEFDINSLRPNETKWLGPLLLLKPIDNELKIRYDITSQKSSGDVSRVLYWKQNP